MHCLIVDDDPLICDLLQHFCSKVDFISNTTVTGSGFESINLLGQHTFDLVLLDYDLPDVTGKEILPLITAETAVIMVTAHKDFASESYEYDQVVDYLVKPVKFSRFYQGVQKAKKYVTKPGIENSLFVKDGTRLTRINLDNVLFIRSAGNYAELHFSNKKVLTLMTLKQLEQKLPDFFQRVHRSCIVNVQKIDSIANGELIINQHEVSISASYEKELMKKIILLS
ncbi:MAG: DNA-binding response regulator [Cyclobacteriaceae bacterium]|nr:MAG: DNA-binding response regulator [Cyclobacteriaceae bacterium]